MKTSKKITNFFKRRLAYGKSQKNLFQELSYARKHRNETTLLNKGEKS